MKVKELIARLLDCNPEADVCFSAEAVSGDVSIDNVSEDIEEEEAEVSLTTHDSRGDNLYSGENKV